MQAPARTATLARINSQYSTWCPCKHGLLHVLAAVGDASVDAAASAVSSSKGGSARNSGTGAARGSSIGNTAAAGVNRYDGATRTADDEGGLQAPGAGQDESGLSQQQEVSWEPAVGVEAV